MENLKERRESLGISREKLAVEAGLSLATVQRIETGKIKPHRATVRAIEAVLAAAVKPA